MHRRGTEVCWTKSLVRGSGIGGVEKRRGQMLFPPTAGRASDIDPFGVQTRLQRAVQDPEATGYRVGVQGTLQGTTESSQLWNKEGK